MLYFSHKGWLLVKCSDVFRAQCYDWHRYKLTFVFLWLSWKLGASSLCKWRSDCIFHTVVKVCDKCFLFWDQNFKLQVFLILSPGISNVIPTEWLLKLRSVYKSRSIFRVILKTQKKVDSYTRKYGYFKTLWNFRYVLTVCVFFNIT